MGPEGAGQPGSSGGTSGCSFAPLASRLHSEKRGVTECSAEQPHAGLPCDLKQTLDSPCTRPPPALNKHTYPRSLMRMCTPSPHPNLCTFVGVIHKLISEKALGSLHKALKINSGVRCGRDRMRLILACEDGPAAHLELTQNR